MLLGIDREKNRKEQEKPVLPPNSVSEVDYGISDYGLGWEPDPNREIDLGVSDQGLDWLMNQDFDIEGNLIDIWKAHFEQRLFEFTDPLRDKQVNNDR